MWINKKRCIKVLQSHMFYPKILKDVVEVSFKHLYIFCLELFQWKIYKSFCISLLLLWFHIDFVMCFWLAKMREFYIRFCILLNCDWKAKEYRNTLVVSNWYSFFFFQNNLLQCIEYIFLIFNKRWNENIFIFHCQRKFIYLIFNTHQWMLIL